MDHNVKEHHHYILPTKTALFVGVSLFVLTGLTVAMSYVHLGRFNLFAALLVAALKASLVATFFMNLKHDRKEYTVIFLTSFLFLGIFIALTGTDVFFRGDVYVKGPLLTQPAAAASKFAKPWVPTPELVAHGRELFSQQCVACHGAEGKGDGAAAAALDPHPRNFHQVGGWVNGHKPSQIFKTLKEGIPGTGMASYGSLPAEDLWAIAHFVETFNPQPETDELSDLAKIGVDPNNESASEVKEASIPIDAAMKILSSD